MKSNARTFLASQQTAGTITDMFCTEVGIPMQRVESIINGGCGATMKEIINVAKYFKVPLSAILECGAPILVHTIECGHCKEWFIPANARAIYCSDACRNRAFRGTGNKKK
jgi:hypothetical protein